MRLITNEKKIDLIKNSMQEITLTRECIQTKILEISFKKEGSERALWIYPQIVAARFSNRREVS